MNMQINNNLIYHKSNYLCNSVSDYPKNYGFIGANLGLKNDCFCPSPNFAGKKINKKVIKRLEYQLRDLDGVHDPYSDVVMISKKKFQSLSEKIRKKTSASGMIKLLSGYTQHMFPDGEAKVFELLKYEVKQQPKSSTRNFHDILQEHLPESKVRLVNNQLDVVDYMRDYTKHNFSKHNQDIINKKLNKIEADIMDDDFRIKPTLSFLNELYKEVYDKKNVKKLLNITNDFPNGATSIDAFIVKNANKSSEDIAEALVSPSLISVEHTKAQSNGGETKGANLIAASVRMNRVKGSTSVPDFIERFPNIPQQTQRYADDLILKINRGGIPDIAFTMPGVKETLKHESGGQIDIDISGIRQPYMDKIGMMKQKVDKLVSFFSK